MTVRKDVICVTGGGGYLGQHIVRAFLRDGYDVRATLRNLDWGPALKDKIMDGLSGPSNRLEFVKADVTIDEGWDAALSGCVGLIHAASPFPPKKPKNAKNLILVAEEGTKRVLKQAVAAGVKRVVVTSSIVAMVACDLRDGQEYYTEDDWSNPDHDRCDAYACSKLLAEQAAWEIAKQFGLELVTLNPGLILGAPVSGLGATSVEVVNRVLSGKDLALPGVSMPCVDVQDVASAHVRAIGSEAAIGERIYLGGPPTSFKDISEILRPEYPRNKISRVIASDMMVRAAAKFDPSLANVLPYLGATPDVRSQKAQDILGISYREVRESILETAAALQKKEHVVEPA